MHQLAGELNRYEIWSLSSFHLKTLSGKPPWSDVREDAMIVLRLAKGQRPSRPVSQSLDDRHWEFIQQCWTSVEDRPSSEMVVQSVQHLLSYHSNPRPLRESFTPLVSDRATSAPTDSSSMTSSVPVPLPDARWFSDVRLDDYMSGKND